MTCLIMPFHLALPSTLSSTADLVDRGPEHIYKQAGLVACDDDQQDVQAASQGKHMQCGGTWEA